MEDVNTASKSEGDVLDDKAFEEEVEYVWEELYESAVWDFCFDVHRAIKLDYLWLDPGLDPNVDLEKEKKLQKSDKAENDATGQKEKAKAKNETYNLICPNCDKQSTAAALGKHLPVCLGLGGRIGSRDVTKKTNGSDDVDDDNNSSSSSGKKKSMKSQVKKPFIQKITIPVESSPKPQSPNTDCYEAFQSLTYEEKEAFLKEKCGVLNLENKRCVNSLTCDEHTNEDRRIIRLAHLSRFHYPKTEENDGNTAAESTDSGSGDPLT